MIETVPYWCRIALLLALMAVVVMLDRRRNGPQATRLSEYSFVLAAGVLGALFGLVNDLITSSISSDYFAYGKGLGPGEGLTLRVAILGIKAGFSAGAVAGAVCLYINTRDRTRPPIPYRRLLGYLWRPVVLAAVSASILALVFRRYDPLHFSAQLEGVLDSQRIERFLLVWWIHLGLYLGLLASVVWIGADVARLRRTQIRESCGNAAPVDTTLPVE